MARRAHERVTEALRADEPRLDDLTRARMERRLVESVARGRRGDGTDGGEAGASKRSGGSRRRAWIAGGALAAAAVALVVWLGGGEGVEVAETEASSPATFTSFQDGETVRRGAFAEGESVRTVEGQRVEVRLADARVDVTPGSVARFVRFDRELVRVALSEGAVEVEFHPARRGEQSLTVSTPAADVEVVGTVFRVEVDRDRATTVRVEDGVVRVVPTGGGEPRLVHAGEAAHVPLGSATAAGPGEEASGGVGSTGTGTGTVTVTSTSTSVGTSTGTGTATDDGSTGTEPGSAATDDGASAADDGPEEAAPAADATELSMDARFDLANLYVERGQLRQARHVLYAIARSPARRAHRVRAWNDIAASYERERAFSQAAEAYRRAAQAGRRTAEGRNALYALARVLDRQVGDPAGAKAAYKRYIDQAAEAQLRGDRSPSPHLHLSRQRLCQLGETAYCRE